MTDRDPATTQGFALLPALRHGEMTVHATSVAMAAAPPAATAWGSLMPDNDPVQALAACGKSVSTSARPFALRPLDVTEHVAVVEFANDDIRRHRTLPEAARQ